MFRFLFFLLVLRTFSLSAQPRTADWLFVYYMPYDNNMSALGEPILNMIQSGITSDKVIATVQADFSNSGMKRYLILKDTMLTFDIRGEASAHTLSYQLYLEWVRHVASGKKRAIVFLDHGGALDELGYDETPARKFLRVDSLRSVLENFNKSTKHKTDLLYLQVCAKGSIEPLYELRNTARYTMASQNELGAPNHYYEKLFNDLSQNKRSELEVANMLVDFERADMYYSVTCINNASWAETQKLFAAFMTTLDQEVHLPTTPLMLSYYKQTYWDLISFLNVLDLVTDPQKEARRMLVTQIEKELIVFHKKEASKETMDGYSGLSLVLLSQEKAEAFAHLYFFADFKTPDLTARIKKGKDALSIGLQRGAQKKNLPDTFGAFHVPEITWTNPAAERSVFRPEEDIISLRAIIESKDSLKYVSLTVYGLMDDSIRGRLSLPVTNSTALRMVLSRVVNIPPDGAYFDITAKTVRGKISTSRRTVLPDVVAVKDRTDYALIFASDSYDNWPPLANPIFDARTLESKLRYVYGFRTELVENSTRERVIEKLGEYAGKNFDPLDQLFIFFAGHGYFDPISKDGFIVTTDARPVGEGLESYIGYNRLRSLINNNSCRHILVALDVCFGGTFDEVIAKRGLETQSIYENADKAEIITRKLRNRTRFYLTSGGREYVSDGVAGSHSPFVWRLLTAMDSWGGQDGLLTTSELNAFMESLKIEPRFGTFGDHEPGGDFLFVVK